MVWIGAGLAKTKLCNAADAGARYAVKRLARLDASFFVSPRGLALSFGQAF